MKKMLLVALVLGVVVVSGAALAEIPALELATERGCFTCHTIHQAKGDTKPLAPSYQEIAERYRTSNDAFQYLVNRVLHGTLYTEQNWANDISMRFMPPNVNVTRLEAGELTNWILNLPVNESLRNKLAEHEAMLILSARSGCPTCHLMDTSPDSRLMPLAPAFRDIARRYKNEPDARKRLVRSIIYGTRAASKTWPDVNMQFMPPNVALDLESAEQLAQWILKLK